MENHGNYAGILDRSHFTAIVLFQLSVSILQVIDRIQVHLVRFRYLFNLRVFKFQTTLPTCSNNAKTQSTTYRRTSNSREFCSLDRWEFRMIHTTQTKTKQETINFLKNLFIRNDLFVTRHSESSYPLNGLLISSP